MLSLVSRALSDPLQFLYAVRGVIDRDGLFARYASLACRAGIDRVYLVLSFDCDTVDDAEAAARIHPRLIDMGVTAVYAVPGELLKKSADIYRRIAETGAEFLNHGGCEHTYFDETVGRQASSYFYDQLSEEEVEADIRLGHDYVSDVIGFAPTGFRTPHFGTFCRPEHLRRLHSLLRGMGYRFSTSTTPFHGFRFGSVFERDGIAEIPVSGMWDSPLNILDSWSCFAAPDRTLGPGDYIAQGGALARKIEALGVGVLNFYADPAHVADRDEFFEAVAGWVAVARSVNYSQLLEAINGPKV